MPELEQYDQIEDNVEKSSRNRIRMHFVPANKKLLETRKLKEKKKNQTLDRAEDRNRKQDL
jgi:hypothetical protein